IIENYKKELEKCSQRTNNFEDQLLTLKEKYKKEEDIFKKLKDELAILDVAKQLLSEDGLKTVILKQILTTLNQLIQQYLHKLDNLCKCSFNEYLEDNIVNNKGHSCSYFNFSGAERKSIDLACLFSFLDLKRLKGDVIYNVCFFDELL